MDANNQQDDVMGQVKNYREKVAIYESLRVEINTLLKGHNGGTEHMHPDDLARYRELARQRDEALNEMRWFEQQLLDENENEA
jgi:hypothetical protein